jgi:hypothetical protein
MPSQSPHRPPPLPPRRASDSDVCWTHPTTPLPSVSTTTETKPAMRPSRCSSVVDIAATTANKTTGTTTTPVHALARKLAATVRMMPAGAPSGVSALSGLAISADCATRALIHLALSATGIFHTKIIVFKQKKFTALWTLMFNGSSMCHYYQVLPGRHFCDCV